MKTLIISGGQIDKEFLKKIVYDNDFNYIVGVDKGIDICYQCNLVPSILMGDFDSVDGKILEHYERNENIKIQRFSPQKDDTDTQMAINHAIHMGSKEIAIVGATGSRIDHLLGNIQCLYSALNENITCYIIDKNNKIELIKENRKIQKSEQYGNFISLLALTDSVTKLTLQGFKYPLNEYMLTNHSGGLGVSNEIVEEYAQIIFQTGILIMIQSKD